MIAGSVEQPAGLAALRVAAWSAIPDLVHGFFARRGGVSSGPWSSLNVSENVGDDPDRVATNCDRIGTELDLSLVRMRQVHGKQVVRVASADQPAADADGMIADTAGVGLTILTADCVPILGVAPSAHAVMALHAGWRGTVAGVIAAGLTAAQDELGIDPAAWHVALGPSIGGCCYEVEAQIGNQLVDRWGAMPDAWQPAAARGQLDLRIASQHILRTLGVPERQIVVSGPCTACRPEEYFSHRGSGGRAGRQASVIGWAK